MPLLIRVPAVFIWAEVQILIHFCCNTMFLECYLSCFKVIGEKRRNIPEEEEYISKKCVPLQTIRDN